MNKKTNTLLLIVGATIFNIFVTILCFFVLLLVYVKFIITLLPEDSNAWGFPVIFIGAVAMSFFIYRFALKLLIKKINVDKYFDPIFGGKNRGS